MFMYKPNEVKYGSQVMNIALAIAVAFRTLNKQSLMNILATSQAAHL